MRFRSTTSPAASQLARVDELQPSLVAEGVYITSSVEWLWVACPAGGAVRAHTASSQPRRSCEGVHTCVRDMNRTTARHHGLGR